VIVPAAEGQSKDFCEHGGKAEQEGCCVLVGPFQLEIFCGSMCLFSEL